MTHFRLIALSAALVSATFLGACNTAPERPMNAASGDSMATPGNMAKMDVQMKTMQGMHEKMMNAKTPAERSKLMAEHKKAMQDGMDMMGSMPSSGLGDMKGMPGMAGDMGMQQQMMAKRMEMMQTMMKMMMDQMPPAPGNQ